MSNHCGNGKRFLDDEQVWRAALMLNNAAVTILARGCFDQGKYLLQLALRMIRLNSTPTQTNGSDLLSEILACSSQQVAQMSSLAQGLPLLANIQVLETERSMLLTFDGTLRPDIFIFARIEASFGQDEEQAGSNRETHAGLMLYNLGTLHLCQDLCRKGSISNETKRIALHFLHMSHALLARNDVMGLSIPDLAACAHMQVLRLLAGLLAGFPGQEHTASSLADVVQHMQGQYKRAASVFPGHIGAPAA